MSAMTRYLFLLLLKYIWHYIIHLYFHFTLKIAQPTNSPDFHLKSKKLFDINVLEWI